MGIQARVVDGYFQAPRGSAVESDAQYRLEFLPREPAGIAVIDGGHDRIVEAIGIDVDEESVEAPSAQVCDCSPRSRFDSEAPHRAQIEARELVRQRLAPRLCLILPVAPGEGDSILASHDRATA